MEFGSLQQKQQCPSMGKVNEFGERLWHSFYKM